MHARGVLRGTTQLATTDAVANTTTHGTLTSNAHHETRSNTLAVTINNSIKHKTIFMKHHQPNMTIYEK
jgi:hypothetical protein